MRHVHRRKASPHGGSLAVRFSRYPVIRNNLVAISHRILIDGIYGHQSIAFSENHPECALQGMLDVPTQIRSNKILSHPVITFLCLLDYRLIFPTPNCPNDTLSLRCGSDRREYYLHLLGTMQIAGVRFCLSQGFDSPFGRNEPSRVFRNGAPLLRARISNMFPRADICYQQETQLVKASK